MKEIYKHKMLQWDRKQLQEFSLQAQQGNNYNFPLHFLPAEVFLFLCFTLLITNICWEHPALCKRGTRPSQPLGLGTLAKPLEILLCNSHR